MGILHGIIHDSVSGASVEAKVHVLTSNGHFVHPSDSILKVGPGDPFFYSTGEFTVNVPRGSTDIIVERGTEYEPLRKVVSMPQKGAVEVELPLKRWADFPSQGWYPGNTHLHYSEKEMRPDDRLRLASTAMGGIASPRQFMPIQARSISAQDARTALHRSRRRFSSARSTIRSIGCVGSAGSQRTSSARKFCTCLTRDGRLTRIWQGCVRAVTDFEIFQRFI